MARISYPTTSPYSATGQNNWHIGRYAHRTVPSHSSDSIYTIETKFNLRPDLLAYDLYGNPSYWWVFLIRNPDLIRDPIWDFTAGKTIIVPSHNHLKASLG